MGKGYGRNHQQQIIVWQSWFNSWPCKLAVATVVLLLLLLVMLYRFVCARRLCIHDWWAHDGAQRKRGTATRHAGSGEGVRTYLVQQWVL